MGSTEFDKCEPELVEKFTNFMIALQEEGLDFIVTCTSRSIEEQRALYLQGRFPLSLVNQKRRDVGLYDLKPEENVVVTGTIDGSNHVIATGRPRARAFDIALKKDGKVHYNLKENINKDEYPDYEEAGLIGERCGLKWGGRFTKRDYCHFEI